MPDPISRRAACGLIAACLGAVAGAAHAAPSPAELARIERLLVMIGSRRDMRLLRNGTEHDSDTAVSFLRGKLKHYGSDIKTAEEFIDRLASRSSTTGKLYLVRLADGRQIPAGDFLRIELARLDKAAAASAAR
ncbi:MAG TPA: DUF5329 family protein [Aquabacterium sp.]|nr:DUF5329 family protein [Aquabacterium sp.]